MPDLMVKQILFKSGLLCSLVCTMLLLGTIEVQAQFTISESFKGNSTGGITTGGNAVLTSGTIDPINQGWLRLTPDQTDKIGWGTVNQSFPSTLGVYLDFEYTAWRTNEGTQSSGGGDGFSVFLYDAAATFSIGGKGGSLGYAQNTDLANTGLAGGYIGIGLDEYGNYSSNANGKNGGPGVRADAVAIRGPKPTYTYLAGTAANVAGGVDNPNTVTSRPSGFYRRVQIELKPITTGADAGKYSVVVKWKTSASGAFTDLFTTVVAQAPPANMKVGFAASTGWAVNNHEVRNILITTPGGVRVEKFVDKTSALIGDQLTYTVNIYNSTTAPISGLLFGDTLKNANADIVTLGGDFSISSITFNNNGNTGNTAAGYTSGTPKTTGFTNPFSATLGMAANSNATFTIVGTINSMPSGGSLVNTVKIDPGPTGITDQDLTNNIASVGTLVQSPNVDMDIVKTVNKPCADPTAGNTYTITVSNTGANNKPALALVTVIDTIPAGFTAGSITNAGWTRVNVGNIYTFTRTDALAAGFSYPAITINVTPPATGTSWATKASVLYTGVETNLVNNVSGVSLYNKPAAPVVSSPVNYCQNATAIQLTATGNNLLWYNIAAGGTGAAAAPTPATATAGNTIYYVSQSNGSCESNLSPITVTVKPIPDVNAVNEQTLCNGATTTAVAFTGSQTGTGFAWTNNKTSIGLAANGNGNIAAFPAINTGIADSTATITVSPSLNGCIGTAKNFTITVHPKPQGTLLSDMTICKGQQLQLTFNRIAGTGPFTLIINSVTHTGIQSGVPFIIPGPTQTTVYNLTSIKDSFNCVNP